MLACYVAGVTRLFFATLLASTIASTIASAFACGGGAATQAPVQATLPTTPAQVLREATGAVEQYRQAYQVRSAEALIPLYAPDAVLVNQGGAHRGGSAVAAYVTALLARASEIQIKITNLDVAAVGADGARAVATLVRTISDGVTSVQEKGALTLTFRRDPSGAWLIVSEHFSYRRGP